MIFGAPRGSSVIHHGRVARYRRDQRQIALGVRHRFDRGLGAEMRHIRHEETEMEARGIAHRGFADRHVGMYGERRLHIGEGRDDHAPDALDGIERQDAAMALDQAPHHVGLARRAKRRADLLGLLHPDQPVDDVATLHQQPMHLLVDRIDLLAQIGKRWRGGRRLGHRRDLATCSRQVRWRATSLRGHRGSVASMRTAQYQVYLILIRCRPGCAYRDRRRLAPTCLDEGGDRD